MFAYIWLATFHLFERHILLTSYASYWLNALCISLSPLTCQWDTRWKVVCLANFGTFPCRTDMIIMYINSCSINYWYWTLLTRVFKPDVAKWGPRNLKIIILMIFCARANLKCLWLLMETTISMRTHSEHPFIKFKCMHGFEHLNSLYGHID